jgi:hypothetical protein
MLTSLRIASFAVAVAAFAAGPAFAAWPGDPAINVPLCTAANGQQFPVAVSDGASGAIVAWWDLRSGASFDVYAQRVLASGEVDPAWPANGRALCTAIGDQQYPAIVSDGGSGAIVVWCDGRTLSSFDVYAQHVLASGVVDPAWPANGRAVCTAPGSQWFPSIASDGAGGAIVAWHDGRSLGTDIYAQHVLASGVVDPAWPANGRPVCVATGDQEEVQVVSDGAAGVLLAWSDARGGANTDVYAHHVLASGVVDPAWPAGGRAVCTATGNQVRPRVTGDGVAGLLVAWADARGGLDYDVYAQRVLATGAVAPGWPADGRALCDMPQNQTEPVLVTDGASGALVAWTDNRPETHSDVYAQHVLSSGAVDPAWPSGGRALCAAPENQHSPDLVADGGSGAIVAWADSRGGAEHDLYTQHVLGSGAVDPAWPADGRAVSTASGDQQHPVIVSMPAGVGSAPIVAWDDTRSGNFDIYAQLATPVVAPGAPEPAIFAVRDVKPDQGGFVSVSWNASGLDVAPTFGITQYRVWRLGPGSIWQPVGFLAASAQAGYSLPVPTTNDSTPGSVPFQVFRIEARGDTLIPAQHWFSAPDSGYSVDNLAPIAPAGFTGLYAAGTTTLHWGANAEPDLASYRLYRGTWANFPPAPSNLVAVVTGTSYADPAGSPQIYKLCAVDAHGNPSPYATFLPEVTTGADAAPRAFLELAGANPGRGAFALRFGLAQRARVTLAILDPAGRRVRILARGEFEAGEHAMPWDGRDEEGRGVAPGLYFARLETAGFTATRRIVRTN